MANPPPRTLKVLYTLHPSLETLDLAGPLEILSHATFTTPLSTRHSPKAPVFESVVTAVDEFTTTNQNLTIKRHIPTAEAYATLSDYDVLIIPGGGTKPILENTSEPIGLIAAFERLLPREDGGIRTILSVCTGSLFLAEAGVLKGLAATTHPNYYGQLRDICASKGGRTQVLEERFVVNVVDTQRGLRVVTSGGVSCGMDASLWLIDEVAGGESKTRASEAVMYQFRDGVVLEKNG